MMIDRVVKFIKRKNIQTNPRKLHLKTNSNNEKAFFKQGDIVYVNFGEALENEQGGIRPCIILQNDVGNKYSRTTIVAPLSSTLKKLPTHFYIDNYEDVGLKNESMIMFEQIRAISKIRILDEIPVGHIELFKFCPTLLNSFGIKQEMQTI